MSPDALSADRIRLLSRLLNERKIAPRTPPIPRRRDGLADIPLSFAQQRIWFVHRLQPASSLYNGAGTARLRGHLDVEIVRRCVNETIRRHEILRTTYRLSDGRPVQRVEAPGNLPLPVTDLTGLPSSARSAAARICLNRLMNQPFDLEREPPIRVELLRLAPQEHRLVLVMHHIAGDGWSLGVFHREMAALYAAYLTGRPSPLPELSLQYGDFAVWQREWLSGDANGELDYWRERLEGAALLELPTVRPRQAGGHQDGSAAVIEFAASLVRRLSSLGDAERSTLYMVLLAATAVIFSRWSGQQDVVIGTPIANRNRLDLEGLIGCFVNTLPLRLDTSGNPSFRSLLRQARHVCLGAYARQDAPFERIVESVNPIRGIGGETPLVRHMLGLDNAPRPIISLPDLDVEFDFVRPEKARFDIEWVLKPTSDGGLSGRVWFAKDLFDQAYMARLLASVRTVLMAVAADPDMAVGRLPILAESERVQLVERFSGTAHAESALNRKRDELAAAADQLVPGLGPERAHLIEYSMWMRDSLGLLPGEATLYLGPQNTYAAQLEPLAPVLLGGRVVTADQPRAADGAYLAALIAAERPGVVTCTPSQLAALLASGHAAGLMPRHLLLGGEEPWPGLVTECRRMLPEACVWSIYRLGGLPVLAGRLPGDAPGVRAAGRPIAGAVLSVLDSRAELVPIGVTGELCVAGSVAAPGLEPVTSHRLPGKTPLRTGARARWLPNGVLEVIGQVGGGLAAGRPTAAKIREALLSHPVVDRAEVTAGLVAHVSLRREVEARNLRTLFEERYARRSADDDPALNPATWTSPVTGTRLSAADLRDWSDTTVRRALALQPRRMLEIGCRNGQLLLRLAPHCESYVATDLSARALRHIRESKDWVVGRSDAIQLLRLAPDDLDALEQRSVDLVLVNSIVQYSPGPGYLEQVITAAARVARPPAAILISDVRSLPLLPALHVFAAFRSAPGTSLADLRQLVTDKIDGDDELAIDPAWFAQVAARLPGISDVTVLARPGRAQELAGYRYDVLLRVGEQGTKAERCAGPAACELTAAQAGNLLREHSPDPVGIRDVPDEPVRIAARAAQLLAESTAANVAELWDSARAEVTSAVTLTGLRSAAARFGYDTVLAGPAASGTPGLLDVVMSRAPAAGEVALPPRLGPALAGPLGYANDVGYAARARAAVPLLQGHLRERLPPAMIPQLAVRRTWPVGRSGVLDPDQLPQPRAEVRRVSVRRSPRTDLERAIAKIWADVLGLDQVGIDDDFFALGGHSLMATEVADRIRSELGLELPLGQLFDEPTVTSVARYLEAAASDGPPAPAIERVDRRSYRRRVTASTREDSHGRSERRA